MSNVKADARGLSLNTTNVKSDGGNLDVVNPPFFTKSFTGKVALAGAGFGHLVNHGLGVIPKLMRVSLECKIPEGGFTVGMRVDVTSDYHWFASGERGHFNWTSSTQAMWKTLTNNAIVVRPDTGAPFTVSTPNWDVVFDCWA